MPIDSARAAPSPGTQAAPGVFVKQEEDLFHALLHRVRAASDKVHLQDRSETALRLILDRDCDQPVRDSLMAKIAAVVATLPDDPNSERGRTALAQAVEDCLAILHSAEKKRLLSSPAAVAVNKAAVTDSVASYDSRAQKAKLRRSRRAKARPSLRYGLGLAALLLVILASGLAIGLRDRTITSDSTARPLVAQIQAAAHGNVPATNMFGGALKVAVRDGRTVVTIEGVPPGDCVSAGWDLVHSGVLTVNGVTPNRVSAAKLNELCHQEDTATLNWTPKPTAQ